VVAAVEAGPEWWTLWIPTTRRSGGGSDDENDTAPDHDPMNSFGTITRLE
jgi:hypothetical protein